MRCIITGLVICLWGSQAISAESAREFVDLRIQAGLVETRNATGGVTLMAGNLGVRDDTLDVPDDMGFVLGLRGFGGERRMRDGDDTTDVHVASMMGLIGLGYYIDRSQHAELYLGYGRGMVTDISEHGGFHNDGKTVTWSSECGWYVTGKNHIQFGLVGGWSWTDARLENCATQQINRITASGVVVFASVGLRF